MKLRRVQPYRSVFIGELHAEDVRSDGGPLIVLKTGLKVYVGYYVLDELGATLHPINAYFFSPVVACAAADILIDAPKRAESKLTSLLRYEENYLKEF